MKTMGTAISEVASALSEVDEHGNISYNTALKLIDSGYAAAISFDSETGAIRLNTQALKDLTNQKIDAAKSGLIVCMKANSRSLSKALSIR